MPDENKYTSVVAETIEASGNFVNSVKNPLFILIIIFMTGGSAILYEAGLFAYKFMAGLHDIQLELAHQRSNLDELKELILQKNSIERSDRMETYRMPPTYRGRRTTNYRGVDNAAN